jgi:alpha-L-rhamnosidase
MDTGPAADGLRPDRLRTSDLAGPVGIDATVPIRLSWQPPFPQIAAQVEVYAADGADRLWESGRQPGEQPRLSIGADLLDPAERYRWRVRVWDRAGHPSAWSEPAEFGTGPGPQWANSEPIWAAGRPVDWSDYTVAATLVQGRPRPPGTVAVGTGMDVSGAHRIGLVFRAPDLRSGYVWEIDAEAGKLTPMVRVDGASTAIASPTEFAAIPSGQAFRVTISASADEITTVIDDVEVHRITDHRWTRGGAGLTSPADARSEVIAFSVTGADGEILLEQDYAADDRTALAVGAVTGGRLQIAERSNGLYPAQAEWAFLRGEFTVPASVRWAALFVTGSSAEPARQFVHRTTVNGIEVGIGPTRSVAGESRYDAYDVTTLLHSGANAIGVQAWTTTDQRFQAELVAVTEDGRRLQWGTGSDWQGLDGGAVYPNSGSIGTGYYAAPTEDLQYAAFPSGYAEPGLVDDRWQPVVSRPGFAELRPNPTAGIAIRSYRARSVTEIAPDIVVLDFGRTHVGGITLDGGLDQPAEVTLRFAELLDDHGRARYRMATGNTYQDHWTLPAGPVTASTWGLRVFRYLEVHGLDAEAAAELIMARGHVYQLGEPATVATDDRQLNTVLELCRTTMLSNNVNLLVDSWSREREPYEADAYLQARCNAAAGVDLTMTRYALEYLFRRRTWPTEWPFYLVLAAREYWLRSGDASLLHDHFDIIVALLPDAWLDERTGLVIKEFGNDGSSSKIDHDIVDWPPSERDGYVFGPINTVVNALAHGCYRAMAEIADGIGRPADARRLGESADRLAEAINTLLWDENRLAYRDGLDAAGEPIDHHAMHADVFAAAFGVAGPERLAIIGERLATEGIRTSVYVAPFLIEALYAAGRDRDAHRQMINDGPRSWLGMISKGAGATMEAWSEELKPNVSCAHPWAASPLFLVAERMAGIRPIEPGYRSFEIRPRLGSVGLLRQRLATVAGEIAIMINVAADHWQVELDVPAGTTARLVLPDDFTEVTDGSDRPVTIAELTELGAGRHLLFARRPTCY